MPARIDPNLVCLTSGCSRPRECDRSYCSGCIRLARAVGRSLGDEDGCQPDLTLTDVAPSVTVDTPDAEARLPRCVAYLSLSGDVITLELTGAPGFTEADVELVAQTLMNRGRSEFSDDRRADLADDCRASERAELEDGES